MRYPSKSFWRRRGLTYGAPWSCGAYTLQWADNDPLGGPKPLFERVGYADKILGLRHKGWFTNEFQDETVRGAVYKLPLRQPSYLAGFGDPTNGEDFGVCYERCVYDDPEEAARYADNIAEAYAEKEREYQEASSAACKCEMLDSRIDAIRTKIKQVLAEARPHRKTGSAGTLCAFLKDGVTRLLEERSEAIAARNHLVREWRHSAGFEYA